MPVRPSDSAGLIFEEEQFPHLDDWGLVRNLFPAIEVLRDAVVLDDRDEFCSMGDAALRDLLARSHGLPTQQSGKPGIESRCVD